MYRKYLPLLVLFLILLSIVYFFLMLPEKPSSILVKTNDIVECTEGEIKECTTSDNCKGTVQCNEGEWGVCVVQKICLPGSEIECREDCLVGYRECNACGTNYSECIFP